MKWSHPGSPKCQDSSVLGLVIVIVIQSGMNKSMDAAHQALNAALLSLDKSLDSHAEDFHTLAPDIITEIVEDISHEIHGNLKNLAEMSYVCLENYLDHWKLQADKAPHSSLWTTLMPGTRVVVGLSQSSPHHSPSQRHSEPKSLLRTTSRWDEAAKASPFLIADQYIIGTLQSTTSLDVNNQQTTGLHATVAISTDTNNKEIITVPISSIFPYKPGGRATTTSHVAGGYVLMECPSQPGVYEPAVVIAVNHHYTKSPPSESKSSTGDKNDDDGGTNTPKEISVQYCHSNDIVHIVADEIDPFHLCNTPEGRHRGMKTKKCNCQSVLILEDHWAAVSPQSLHALGFLLDQVPDLLLHFVANKLTTLYPNMTMSSLLTPLTISLQQQWHTSLQTFFYRHDYIQHASLNTSIDSTLTGVAAATSSETNHSCGLRDLVIFVKQEIQRIHGGIFVEKSSKNEGDQAQTGADDRLKAAGSSNIDKKQYPRQPLDLPLPFHPSPVSSVHQNIKFIRNEEIFPYGSTGHIVACQDDFTYSNRCVMPFTYEVPFDFSSSHHKEGYDTLSHEKATCQQIQHSCRLLETLFQLGIDLLESIHPPDLQNDFLFSISASLNNKQLEHTHLSTWFDSCDNDDNNDNMKDNKESGNPNMDDDNHSATNSGVPKLNFDDIPPDDDDDLSSVNKTAAKGSAMDGLNDALGGSSRLLKFVVSLGHLASSDLPKIVGKLPAPYEVDINEWGVTMSSILNTRAILLSFITLTEQWVKTLSKTYQQRKPIFTMLNNTLQSTIELLVESATELHDIIPLKIDEALAYMSHTLETVVVSSVWREEWQSNSPYKKGQKVSSGVLSLVLMYRGWVHSFLQTLQSHSKAVHRLCGCVTSLAIRAVLNAYSAVTPSRVRQVQIQKDLTAALASIADTLRLLVEKGVILEATPPSTSSAADHAVFSDHITAIHQLQQNAFYQYTLSSGSDSSLHNIISSFCQNNNDDGRNQRKNNPAPAACLSELHTEDYGFGDGDLEYLTHLKDDLLELMLLTHINIASSESINTLVAKLADTSPTPKGSPIIASPNRPHQFSRRHSSGLEMFDNYYHSTSDSIGYPSSLLALKPFLVRSNVRSNTTKIVEQSALSLTTILSFVVMMDNKDDKGCRSGVFSDAPIFDTGAELLCCYGGKASKAGELFCTIDTKVLHLLTVHAPFLLTILPMHRRELIVADYPPLTDQEVNTKELLETFLSLYESDIMSGQDVLEQSLADMKAITDGFPFQLVEKEEEASGAGDDNKEDVEKISGASAKSSNNGGTGSGSGSLLRTENELDDCGELEFYWEEE